MLVMIGLSKVPIIEHTTEGGGRVRQCAMPRCTMPGGVTRCLVISKDARGEDQWRHPLYQCHLMFWHLFSVQGVAECNPQCQCRVTQCPLILQDQELRMTWGFTQTDRFHVSKTRHVSSHHQTWVESSRDLDNVVILLINVCSLVFWLWLLANYLCGFLL